MHAYAYAAYPFGERLRLRCSELELFWGEAVQNLESSEALPLHSSPAGTPTRMPPNPLCERIRRRCSELELFLEQAVQILESCETLLGNCILRRIRRSLGRGRRGPYFRAFHCRVHAYAFATHPFRQRLRHWSSELELFLGEAVQILESSEALQGPPNPHTMQVCLASPPRHGQGHPLPVCNFVFFQGETKGTPYKLQIRVRRPLKTRVPLPTF